MRARVAESRKPHMATALLIHAAWSETPQPLPTSALRYGAGRGQQRRVQSAVRIAKAIEHARRHPDVEHAVESCATCGSRGRAKVPATMYALADVYEFGVLDGFGLRAWLRAMPLLNVSVDHTNAFGFDSFQGMPEEKTDFLRPRHQHNANWLSGGLSTATYLHMKANESERILEAVQRNIGFDATRTHLIRGFFNESLRNGASLAQSLGMRPALLLDIDCDLYSSSKQALQFMLEEGLLVPGTFVYYDDYSLEDWRVSPKKHPYKEERLAHYEITEEWRLTWRQLPTYVYREPVEGLGWITQWPNTSRFANHPIHNRELMPVLQLMECERCPRSR